MVWATHIQTYFATYKTKQNKNLIVLIKFFSQFQVFSIGPREKDDFTPDILLPLEVKGFGNLTEMFQKQ